jgi:hypothetical protein
MISIAAMLPGKVACGRERTHRFFDGLFLFTRARSEKRRWYGTVVVTMG